MAREYRSPAVERAIEVLSILADCPSGLTLSALARRTGIPPSTLISILSSLVRTHAVAVDGGKRYRLGLGIFQLGQAFLQGDKLTSSFAELGRELSAATGETVQLGVLSGRDVIYVARHESSAAIGLVTRLGRRIPAHASAQGKVLLAQLSDDQVYDLLASEPLEALTPRTITDFEVLMREFQTIRARGLGEAREECIPGLHCFAAPIFDHREEAVAAISVSVPSVRVDAKRRNVLGRLVLTAGGQITERLGGRQRPQRTKDAVRA